MTLRKESLLLNNQKNNYRNLQLPLVFQSFVTAQSLVVKFTGRYLLSSKQQPDS